MLQLTQRIIKVFRFQRNLNDAENPWEEGWHFFTFQHVWNLLLFTGGLFYIISKCTLCGNCMAVSSINNLIVIIKIVNKISLNCAYNQCIKNQTIIWF